MSSKLVSRRLCTYILTKDTGLAPNPYWGWCTLAVCAPNRQRANLKDGDWIAGFSTKQKGHRLIYVMEVLQRIHMDSYFRDLRFAAKKPNLRGTWQERCGDNFYYLKPDNTWEQLRNRFHPKTRYMAKDTRNPYVFVSRHFWYFGRDAVSVPKQYVPLIGGRGIRVNHPSELKEGFLEWVQSNYDQGERGLPRDNPDAPR